MNRKLRIFILVVVAVIGILFIAYQLILKSAERDITSEKALFTVNSKSISDEFGIDEVLSTKKYQDKTIEISGIVSEQKDNQIILDGIVICEMITNQKLEDSDLKVKIKGRFIGYDELMGELKMDQCTISK